MNKSINESCEEEKRGGRETQGGENCTKQSFLDEKRKEIKKNTTLTLLFAVIKFHGILELGWGCNRSPRCCPSPLRWKTKNSHVQCQLVFLFCPVDCTATRKKQRDTSSERLHCDDTSSPIENMSSASNDFRKLASIASNDRNTFSTCGMPRGTFSACSIAIN